MRAPQTAREELSSTESSEDIFAALLAPDGTPLWSKVFGDANDGQRATGVGFAGPDLLVVGHVRKNVDFGHATPFPPDMGDDLDIFMVRFCP